MSWVQRTDVGSPGQRSHHAMAFDSDRGVVVLFGGQIGNPGSVAYLQGTQEYDGRSWKQVHVTGLEPPARSYHAMTYDPLSKNILLFGGYAGPDTNFGENYADLWAYKGDGTTGTWTHLANGDLPFTSDAAPSLGFVWAMNRGTGILIRNSSEVFEWNGQMWNSLPNAQQSFIAGEYATVFDSARSLVVIIGGENFSQPFGGDISLTGAVLDFSPGNGWSKFGFDIPERAEAAAAYDSRRQRIVVAGGAGAGTTVGEQCFELDSLHPEKGWLSAPNLPSGQGRADAAMVFDRQRAYVPASGLLGVMVLQGGAGGGAPNASDGGAYSDTWELVPVPLVLNLAGPQPDNLTCQNVPLVLNVVPSDGRPLDYHWAIDGNTLEGGSSTLLYLNPPPGGNHVFKFVATDACNNQFATETTLAIHVSPRILLVFSDRDTQLCPGDAITLAASVEEDMANPPLPTTYQWLHNEQPIEGQTQPVLPLKNVQHEDSGAYVLEVSNSCGSVRSAPTGVQVGVTISQEPGDVVTNICQDAAFSVAAQGIGSLQYQWRLDGRPLTNDVYFSGTTNSSLTVRPLLYVHEGSYDVVIADDCGPSNSVTSRVARLTLKPDPQWVLRTTNGPSARTGAAMAYDDKRHVTVLFGGYGTNTDPQIPYPFIPMNDLWEWDGVHWLQRIAQTAQSLTNGWKQDEQGNWHPNPQSALPPVRFYHSMAYDSRRGRVVLFGGDTYDPYLREQTLNDTWEWDGAQWYFGATNGPSPRYHGSMSYDVDHGITLLFSGLGDTTTSTVWKWDGSQWRGVVDTNMASAGLSPNYNYPGSSMAYDISRHQAFFGPTFDGNNAEHFFWSWDGAHWAYRGTGLPPAVPDYAAMVFDEHRRKIVYFGGYFSDETSFWDGAVWAPLNVPTNAPIPAPRFNHALSYDSHRRAVVVFGGANSVNPIKLLSNETWELIAPDKPLINDQPASQYRQPGDTTTFHITAIGPLGTSLTYQWFRGNTLLVDDARISGSHTPQLKIDNVTTADTGIYTAAVSSDCGVSESDPGVLTLSLNLQIFSAANTTSLIWSAPNVALEQADSVNGPWSLVIGASSPFNPARVGSARFFRLTSDKP